MRIYYTHSSGERQIVGNPFSFRLDFRQGWARKIQCRGALYMDYPANTRRIGTMILLVRYFHEEDYR